MLKHFSFQSTFFLFFTTFFILNLHGKEIKYFHENTAVVFMYHKFGEDKYPSTNIRLEQFAKHLDYLEENSYNIWPLSKIIYHVKNRFSIPPKTVAITIDDAYKSVYDNAYPMLKQKGFPYTVFVNTRAIGKTSISYITWDHMREMQRYGAEFANHTSSHPYLVKNVVDGNLSEKEWKKAIKKEIKSAQKKLQKELGYNTNQNPKLFSYPFGEYSQQIAEYIHNMGYVGVSQTSGVVSHYSDLKNIPRFPMAEAFGDMEEFVLKLNTLPLPVKKVIPQENILVQNPPSLKVELYEKIKDIRCYSSDGSPIHLKWLSEKEFEVYSGQKLVGERDRYTCTSKAKGDKWYWFSHIWIIKNSLFK